MQKSLMLAAAAAMTLTLAPAASHAGPPKWAPGHKNSAAHYAPGQVKKRHRSKHGHSHGHIQGSDWVYVDDYHRWGLQPPRHGHRYVRQGDKIFEVVKDTLAIIGAVAVVDALLN
ncbi:RcnB family protein [Leisingera sp. ANG-Vp]|uniref:RcnB family protein n=1 Tax=Leisingera sp. ANG-Vp TaxID=1577896 RepID=UPI000A60BE4F|nr:RcnB family protein [Leisingera sp. ANG-Vp]